uniref:Peroxisomal sarcosine oxidase n=1 Tax=Lynx canadensis TaxID=61383 RepID=A0A667HCC8_LYNCA
MAAQKDLCDAIVIGAGIQGCFTAYHLAKHRKRVILLEQFFLPHSRGSSHGQSRIIRRAYPEDFYTQMMDECYQIWAQLEHEAGTQLHRQTGATAAGNEGNSELKTIQATLSRRGVEHQCLSKWGVLDKSGGVLYADKALRALQDAIRHLGGLVCDGEKVMEIKPGFPVTVKSTAGSYQAKSLVITAGPWTNQLLRPLGIELPLQTLRINVCYWREKVPGSYGVSQAFPCFLGLGLSPAPHHIYGLPSGEYPGLMKVCYQHGNNTSQDVQILGRFVRDHLPDLEPKPALLEPCCTRLRALHSDRHPKYDNVVIGAGFSGEPEQGRRALKLTYLRTSMKLTPSYDLTPFRMSRFPGLGKSPPRPLDSASFLYTGAGNKASGCNMPSCSPASLEPPVNAA